MASGVGFSGLASGLDTDLLIESLLTTKQKRVDNVKKTLDNVDEQKTALKDIKRVLSTLNKTAADLGSVILGNKDASSTDSDAFTATADSDASLASYDLEISNLAQKSVATVGNTVSSTSDSIGAGTLTMNLAGGDSFSLTLSNDSTILDLRDEINEQYGENLGASVIETSPGQFQLLVSTKEMGEDQNILASSSMSGFNTSFLGGGVTNTQAGENSEFTLDGISIIRETNEITDLIEGVTLNLKAETTGVESLAVTSNKEEIIKGLEEFAANYNDALKMIEKQSGSEGVLAGDSSLRSLKMELQNMISGSIPNISPFNVRDNGEMGYTAISQIGFKTDQRTGELSVDKEGLEEALTDNFTEVENLFKGGSLSTNPNVSFISNRGKGFSGTVVLDTLNNTATIDGQLHNLTRDGDVLSFAEGSPYEGMLFMASVADTHVTLEISQGLGSMLEEKTDAFVSFSGILNDRKGTLDEQEGRLNDRLISMKETVANERTRLTMVFAKAEQAISQLQGLQNSLNSL
ncbi:MAG: hypothetical protein CSA81_04325 [Acidobacteria bacterium]|nr:MAG: hypothetical protein CSA81_04325 [Acidobacteriota bacterium]